MVNEYACRFLYVYIYMYRYMYIFIYPVVSNVWYVICLFFWGGGVPDEDAFILRDRWICLISAKVLAQHEEHMLQNVMIWYAAPAWWNLFLNRRWVLQWIGGKKKENIVFQRFRFICFPLFFLVKFALTIFVWTECCKFKRCHCSTVWCDVCKAGHLLDKGIPPWGRSLINSDTSLQNSALDYVLYTLWKYYIQVSLRAISHMSFRVWMRLWQCALDN